jgi:hypothetical protein
MEEIRLFGVLPIKMIFLAGFFILMDLLRLGTMDNVAHFAHLGGIAFGIWSIRNLSSPNNLVTVIQRYVEGIGASLKGGKKLKVKRGGKNTTSKPYDTRSDEEYQAYKKKKQAEIDAILDKISKSGYDSLTKKEKQILFDQSKNN